MTKTKDKIEKFNINDFREYSPLDEETNIGTVNPTWAVVALATKVNEIIDVINPTKPKEGK